MELCGHAIPWEILALIMAELASSPPPNPSSGPVDLSSVYDNLRAVRLTCKTLARTAAVHLFANVPFSTDPEDWVRITAISKTPMLAYSVRRTVYRTHVYIKAYNSEEEYAYGLLDREKPRQTASSGPLDLGNTLFTKDSVRRGYRRYKAKYKNQQRLLSQLQVHSNASDLKILIHAFRRFPNLKEFSISNLVYQSLQIKAWKEAQPAGSIGSTTKTPRWNLRNPGDDDQETVDLLPLLCPSEVYMMNRWNSSRTEEYGDDSPPLVSNGVAIDQFALAKFRGLQLFALAAEAAPIRPLSLSVGFGEGVPLALKTAPLTPLLQSKAILELLTEFNFEITCTAEQDAEFLLSGALGKVMEAAIHLQKIRVRNRYDIGIVRTAPGPSTPESGWVLPLESVFGTSTFRELRFLSIDGVFLTRTDLLDLLSRHKKTLNTLLISGLADFGDDFDDGYRRPGQGLRDDCQDILASIGSLRLRLTRLVFMPRLPYQDRPLEGPEPTVNTDDYWERMRLAIWTPRHVHGTSEIQEFLLSGDK